VIRRSRLRRSVRSGLGDSIPCASTCFLVTFKAFVATLTLIAAMGKRSRSLCLPSQRLGIRWHLRSKLAVQVREMTFVVPAKWKSLHQTDRIVLMVKLLTCLMQPSHRALLVLMPSPSDSMRPPPQSRRQSFSLMMVERLQAPGWTQSIMNPKHWRQKRWPQMWAKKRERLYPKPQRKACP